MKQSADFKTVTPEMAKRFLDRNKGNRPISERNLNFICNAMSRNNFHLTGESIKIAQDGTLIDGQHRLLAIVKTNKAQRMLVITGLDNEAFKYIDTGKNRSAGDVLGIEGMPYANLVAGMVRTIMYFNKGQYGKHDGKNGLSNADISAFAETNKDQLLESLRYGCDKKNKILSKVLLSSFHYVFNKKNEVEADIFCNKLADGTGLSSDSPIYLLRQKLIQNARATRKMTKLEMNALICKAWNAYRDKKKLTVLKYDSIREGFPKPI